MWELLGIATLCFLCASLILPWITRSRLAALRDDVTKLQRQVARLQAGQPATGAATTPETDSAMPIQPASTYAAESSQRENPWRQPTARPTPPPVTNAEDDFVVTELSTSATGTAKPATARTINFEQLFGGRALVWFGGVALACAGFFLVKYSIEQGLLTEQIRTLLGGLFGLALLAAGHKVRLRPHMADGKRIAQALSGAGIAVLYGVCFAAASLYHLIPPLLGFTGMCAVTGTALLLSLQHGAPIAALGLIGGFATPTIMHGEPNAPLLFGYFLVVFGSVMSVIRRAGWWWLALPAVLLAFGAVGFWLALGFGGADAIWLILFLMGISAVTVIGHGDAPTTERRDSRSLLRYLALGGSTILIGAVSFTAHFEPLVWDMFGLFAGAAFILAWADMRHYGFAPWVTAAGSLAMLLGWHSAAPTIMAVTIITFGLLHSGGAYYLMRRAENPKPWAILCALTAALFLLMAYAKLGHGTPANPLWFQHHTLWGIVALGLAVLFTLALRHPHVKGSEETRQEVQGIFAATVATLVAIGGMILLEPNYWPCLIAAEILAAGLINTRANIPGTRRVAQALLIVLGFLFLPSAFGLLGAVFDKPHFSVPGGALSAFILPFLFRYGLTAALLWSGGMFLRQKRDDNLISLIEASSIALLAIAIYKLIGASFAYGDDLIFLEQSIVTCGLGALGWSALMFHRRYGRETVARCGTFLFALAAARLAGFGLVVENPLATHNWVGGGTFINALLPAYGLPILLALGFSQAMATRQRPDLERYGKISAAVLIFVFLSMNIRQWYHGTYLDDGTVGNAEIYTYSLAWLLLGGVFLLAGTIRRDRMLRVASLPLLLLTIGKVFLYDAAELGGLWRVVSFLGLGLSLLGLSWFYSRYVFGTSSTEARKP
ncbi:MAG: DUF2339 domain-containing protein [Alphaproteobacteria bacterium]